MPYSNPLPIPQAKEVTGIIEIPGSKSITNRSILIAALAEGTSYLENTLYSIDTNRMMEVWNQLGVVIEKKENILIVHGCGGVFKSFENEIYIENAGTAARFMTAALNLGSGTYVLTGNERMKERPIKPLLTALTKWGCYVKDVFGTGCPPIEIKAEGIVGGEISIEANQSSQYVSAILLVAPYAKKDTTVRIKGHLVSKTYVEMTRKMMESFGVSTKWLDVQTLQIPAQQTYQAREYFIEGDVSSASYFFALAAITKGKITVKGLSPKSLQGDIGLLQILKNMGCEIIWDINSVTIIGKSLSAVEIDMNTMSDVAPTLAVIALFAKGITKVTNVGNMRIKECDRITAICTELKKLGAIVTEWDDGFSIQGSATYHGATLNTYDDHRMAMSFSLAGLKIPNVFIEDPKCVEKTFPDYFDRFFKLVQS